MIHDKKDYTFVSFNYKNNNFSILKSSEKKLFYEYDDGMKHAQLKFFKGDKRCKIKSCEPLGYSNDNKLTKRVEEFHKILD